MGQYIWEQRDVMSDTEGSGREMREESGTLGTSGERSLEQMHLILRGAYNNLADEQQKLLAKCDTAEQQLNQALCLLFNTLQQDLRDDVHAWFERIEEHDQAQIDEFLEKLTEALERPNATTDGAATMSPPPLNHEQAYADMELEEKSRGAEATQGHHDLAEVNHDLAKADEDQGKSGNAAMRHRRETRGKWQRVLLLRRRS